VKSHHAPSGLPAARTATVDRKVARALEHQRAGRLEEAEGIYRRILDSKPNHSDALHLLGVLGYQVGRSDIAVDLIKKAIAVKGGIAAFHEHLGLALQSQGRLDEAVASFRRALGLDPRLADAHHNLGLALQAKGDLADAAASFHCTIALEPGFAEAYTNLALSWKRKADSTRRWRATGRPWRSSPTSPRRTSISASPCGPRGGWTRRRRATSARCGSGPTSPRRITISARC
jgi:Flp pilus assembly protein TadD